ncbi:hypothetical protein CEUSTIGMA_g6719.t1 [Chlamydomonas eustigma]|uniref:Uncharacterized protein n=1 Tax=Chlamydomonas eustigma TaxID=1157962 RepID=A0A250X8N6_9CHLO|nr:hypothetical protein CEUSTIGMA_g6719.t1 [Chlamydomonas eustigma]|eukprot:GAX79279.1 hypothetical protein CEUSTIGMA_g6719.t1 [Chlamydomonas eustigma]
MCLKFLTFHRAFLFEELRLKRRQWTLRGIKKMCPTGQPKFWLGESSQFNNGRPVPVKSSIQSTSMKKRDRGCASKCIHYVSSAMIVKLLELACLLWQSKLHGHSVIQVSSSNSLSGML